MGNGLKGSSEPQKKRERETRKEIGDDFSNLEEKDDLD